MGMEIRAKGAGDHRLRILGEWIGESEGCEVTSTEDDACWSHEVYEV